MRHVNESAVRCSVHTGHDPLSAALALELDRRVFDPEAVAKNGLQGRLDALRSVEAPPGAGNAGAIPGTLKLLQLPKVFSVMESLIISPAPL